MSLQSELKDAEIIAARRVGRLELAAALYPQHYRALVIDRMHRKLYTFELNPFVEPERALLVLGERLGGKTARLDVAKLSEEAQVQRAERSAEKVLDNIRKRDLTVSDRR